MLTFLPTKNSKLLALLQHINILFILYTNLFLFVISDTKFFYPFSFFPSFFFLHLFDLDRTATALLFFIFFSTDLFKSNKNIYHIIALYLQLSDPEYIVNAKSSIHYFLYKFFVLYILPPLIDKSLGVSEARWDVLCQYRQTHVIFSFWLSFLSVVVMASLVVVLDLMEVM